MTGSRAAAVALALGSLASPAADSCARAQAQNDAGALPLVTVDRDDTVIDRSCRVRFPDGAVIADTNGDGVLHVRADGVVLDATGSPPLRLAPAGTPWDRMTGIGVVVDGRTGVTIRGLSVAGARIGIHARHADRLTIEDADVSDGFAQRLGSTPEAEDSGDWLWPHANDANEWTTRYGAGIWVEESAGVTIRRCAARRRQNGIVIEDVRDSAVYDNDCSFLSGWGLAMWRTTGTVVSRNAFDFCVRGYSHGVYNRGQDSAGILMFEQCSDNIIAENSATHSGDGLFGFAGREALGEVWLDAERARLRATTGEERAGADLRVAPEQGAPFRRRGCNDNLIIRNDFSWAPAHGLEMTFSFGNRIIENDLVGNAICGIWGGYSQDTVIERNRFESNGEGAYGRERGGINIEHAIGNAITGNTFLRNACGVRLWWDDDAALLRTPWAVANGAGACRANRVLFNTFDGDSVGIELSLCEGTLLDGNTFQRVGTEVVSDARSPARGDSGYAPPAAPPPYRVPGDRRPVGARRALAGRASIIMTEWFPWDHESPLLLRTAATGARHQFRLLAGDPAAVRIDAPGAEVQWVPAAPGDAIRASDWRLVLSARDQGLAPYTVELAGTDQRLRGTIVNAQWSAVFFSWRDGPDPREDLDGWRALARDPARSGATTVSRPLPALRFPYGGKGPAALGLPGGPDPVRVGADRFGMIARSAVPLPPGTYRVTTLSDDGVRVIAAGTPVIENWTWHAPTRDTGTFEVREAGTVELVVEHFEIDGAAALTVELEPVTPQAASAPPASPAPAGAAP